MKLKRKEKIYAVCGEGAVTDQKCQNWSVKFHAGDVSLDDAPQSGRPVEVDSNQIETLIESSQRFTMQEGADKLKISKTMKLLVKMKTCVYFMEETKCSWPM